MPEESPQARWRLVQAGSILVAVVLAGWLMLRSYTTEASRECVRRYHAAPTAADTAAVDRVVPSAGANSCGFTRSSARWR